MGLECKACGAPLPKRAATCPACGAAVPKKMNLLRLAAFMLIMILVIQSYMSKPDPDAVGPAPAAETPEQ
ncbi:MAG: zinc ribbon domain-containing protein [Pseudomonas sp.]|nr:zinc ribbon domain-containing protein [Pseudomonas sp.]